MRPNYSDPCNGFGGGHISCAVSWLEPGVGTVQCQCPCHGGPQACA